MDNFHTFWVGAIKHQSIIPLPAGDSRTAFVDARDIGAAAAVALQSAATDGRAYAVTGGESLTYAEAAAVLSRAAGRTITYAPIDDAAFLEGAKRVGLSEEYARMLTVLFGAVRQGAAAQVTTAVEDLTGRAPRTLEAYALEHAKHF